MERRRAFPQILFLTRAYVISESVRFFFSTTLFPSILVPQGIDLASQHLRGERAKNSGWEPHPVVLEEWADEGHHIFVGKPSLLSHSFWVAFSLAMFRNGYSSGESD